MQASAHIIASFSASSLAWKPKRSCAHQQRTCPDPSPITQSLVRMQRHAKETLIPQSSRLIQVQHCSQRDKHILPLCCSRDPSWPTAFLKSLAAKPYLHLHRLYPSDTKRLPSPGDTTCSVWGLARAMIGITPDPDTRMSPKRTWYHLLLRELLYPFDRKRHHNATVSACCHQCTKRCTGTFRPCPPPPPKSPLRAKATILFLIE